MTALFDISLGTLIFSGRLSSYAAIGIGLALVSAVAICSIFALTSSFPSIIGGLDALPAVILGKMATTIATDLPATATSEETLITILCAIALTSLVSGLFFMEIGHLRVGELIRFIPYPIFGGFLAGNGWFLVQGGIETMTDLPLDFSQFPALLEIQPFPLW